MLHGHVDVALTPLGVAQLEAVAERLAEEPLVAVYCSDLSRAVRGAETLARRRSVPVRPDGAFRELNMGRWDGASFRELWQEETELVQAWWADLEGFPVPGGESLAGLRERVLPALEAVLSRHRGETLALVAHGGVNRVILFHALGLDLGHFHSVAQDYGCVNLLEFYPDGEIVLRLLNG
jgi:broad specificity phosphatase PhoE